MGYLTLETRNSRDIVKERSQYSEPSPRNTTNHTDRNCRGACPTELSTTLETSELWEVVPGGIGNNFQDLGCQPLKAVDARCPCWPRLNDDDADDDSSLIRRHHSPPYPPLWTRVPTMAAYPHPWPLCGADISRRSDQSSLAPSGALAHAFGPFSDGNKAGERVRETCR